MKVFGHKRTFLLLTALSLCAASCRFENEHAWDVDLLTPIAQGELSIKDLIRDSTIQENSDKSLKLVSVIPIHEVSMSDLIQIPDTAAKPVTIKLQTLKLGERTMRRDITLGEIAKNAGVVGTIIVANHGSSMAVPPINGMSSGDITINATNFFKTATFVSGTMRITITNGLPVEVTNVIFELRNKTDNATILRDTVPSLAPAATFAEDYPLDGKTVEGQMVAKIVNLNSPGSNGEEVPIDTSDALQVRISALNMQVLEAEAIFPAQDLMYDPQNDFYDMRGPEVTYMEVRSGIIRITAQHTIQENMHLRYYIPDAKKDGQSYEVNKVLPASMTGETVYIRDSMPIDGYGIDFTGQFHDTVNTFYRILSLRIDSTGQIKKLSLKDSIYLTYGLFDIIPQYMKGYLGQENLEVSSTSDFEFLRGITGGSLRLEDLQVNLELSNGIGAPATLMLKQLKAVNSKTGQSRELSTTIPQPILIDPAQDMPFIPSPTTIGLNSGNSNIKELLEIWPDKMEFVMQLSVNPEGNTGEYRDFIYYDSKVQANLNIEMPLQIGLQGITLQDTTTIDIGGSMQLDKIQGGKLNLIAENSFPVDATIQLYVMDKDEKIIDSLLSANSVIEAGIAPPPAYRVTQPVVSTILVKIDPATIELLKNTENKLIIQTKLDTKPLGQNLKIYSDYRIRAKLTGDLRYRTSF